MNFLTLCQELRGETTDSGTGPSAVTGQTGENARWVRWIVNTYRELQNRHADWLWLRSTWTLDTTASDDTYAYGDVTDSRLTVVITRFSRWWMLDTEGVTNIKCYLTSAGVAGERYLSPLTWPAFRDLYKRGTQTNNAPVHVCVDPQRNLVLGPKPNDIYTVTGEYQMGPQVLAANGDTPEMPEQYHQLIVYLAMKKYGGFRSAPDAVSRGILEGNAMLRQLENNQRPKSDISGTLVA